MQHPLPALRMRFSVLFAALLAVVLFVSVHLAHAHETRPVGPYTFVVGFSVEPAYEGQMNGVQLRVRQGEGEDVQPVEGVEATLQVEVTHLDSGISEVMPLRTVFGDPGHYRNNWIPSAPGDYRFRFFGTVGDLDVDETFESGEGTFNPVEPADALYFPEDVPASRELEGAVRGAQSSAEEALGLALGADTAIGNVRTLVMVALGLAVVALLVALVTFVAVRRR